MMTDEQWERWTAEVLAELKHPPSVLSFVEVQDLRRDWEMRMVNPNDRPLILGSPSVVEWSSVVSPSAEVLALEEGAWQELQEAVKVKLGELLAEQERTILQSTPQPANELYEALRAAQKQAGQYRDLLMGELTQDEAGNLVYKVRL